MRTAKEQDIAVSVFKFEATETIGGVLERPGKSDVASGEFSGEEIGIWHGYVCVPSSPGVTLMVGLGLNTDSLEEDHGVVALHDCEEGFLIRSLKFDVEA